ncbi:MAG: fibronectin type III domain-containing protein, partial [Actinomycetota bacterium]|nr:fibronectin type III domain-containing protein [Actinomycetota bacterium]
VGGTSTASVSGSVFTVNSGVTATISGMTIQYGQTGNGGNGGGINNSGTLTATNDTISSNTATKAGGGISNNGGNLTATNDTISSNTAPIGGGIFNIRGTLTATNDTISNNTATKAGGGIFNISGTLTATNDTISNNTAVYGGGIYTNGGGNLTATNDTISGNTASRHGGGIFNGGGNLTATNDTISGNGVNSGGTGGGIAIYGGTLTLAASIIADQTSGGNCSVNSGTITDAGYNLTDGTSCGLSVSSDVIENAPITLPALTTVGSTQVIPIAPLSPAFDIIPSTSVLCTGGSGVSLGAVTGLNIPSTDQVGNPRIVSIGTRTANKCSIGSYQDQVWTPNAPTIKTATPANGSATITWTVPSNNGGSPITSYSVEYATSSTGTYQVATSCSSVSTTSCKVTSLTNGHTYYFEVLATNVVGSGPLSAPTHPVTPIASHHHHRHHHPIVHDRDERGRGHLYYWWRLYFFYWHRFFVAHHISFEFTR